MFWNDPDEEPLDDSKIYPAGDGKDLDGAEEV